jgi:sugar lactone lactonase YvrE
LPAPTASLPFSVDWRHDGRMLIVAGREGLLLRREPDGSLATYADLNGLSDRGWNEIVVDGRGNAYVNGPGFDMMAGEAFAPGIIALVTPNGAVRQVADDVAFPNGMAVKRRAAAPRPRTRTSRSRDRRLATAAPRRGRKGRSDVRG